MPAASPLRALSALALWVAFLWSSCVLLSMLSALVPFDRLPAVRVRWWETYVQGRVGHFDALLHMENYSEVVMHFARDANSIFWSFVRQALALLLIGIFGPNLAESMSLRVPSGLKTLSDLLTFSGDPLDTEETDDVDDDSDPPPLEDCSQEFDEPVVIKGNCVADPVFGSLDRDTYSLWKEQHKEREALRSKASESNKKRAIPPVRYSRVAS